MNITTIITITTSIIMAFSGFLAAYIAIFVFGHNYLSYKVQIVPKYRYHFQKDSDNGIILLRLKLQRNEIPYYITAIKLRGSKLPITSYQIGDKFYNQDNMTISKICKNTVVDIHHLIEPISDNLTNNDIDLIVKIPLSVMNAKGFLSSNTRIIRIEFTYDKYPNRSCINIKLPRNNYTQH